MLDKSRVSNTLTSLAASVCILFSAPGDAKTTLVIKYGTKHPLTTDVSSVGWWIFSKLDEIRAQSQEQMKQAIDDEDRFYDVDVELREDVLIKKVKRTNRSYITVNGYGANMDWRIRCGGLVNPSVDVSLGVVRAYFTYDNQNGLSDSDVELVNLQIDYSGGISICGLPFINDNIRDKIRSEFKEKLASGIQAELDDINVPGIAAPGSQLRQIIDAIPNKLFYVVVGISKDTFLQQIENPAEDTEITVRFDEDGFRTDSDANDVIDITVFLPWDQFPVANINAAHVDGIFTGQFSASGSYDPDGGAIVSYKWDFGDGHTRITTVPYTSYVYDGGSTEYTATVTVTDDEGSTSNPVGTYVCTAAPGGSGNSCHSIGD